MERVPIQTYVMEYNDEMVREAIHRELARGGQVYYVYNRVSNIDEIAGHVASLVPDAQVAFAHGQMNERQLERIMLDFVNGDIDVLVSTTIIETGLDIPNANTMIIHDADRLGLSQLYQIRGRIGRSNRTSLCVPHVQAGQNAAGGGGKAPAGHSGIYGAGLRHSRSPCGIWRSAGRGTSWERSNTATWRPWGMICTARC